MPQAAKPEAAFEYRHLVLLASVLFYFFGMGGMFLLVVALKPLALDFGWNRSVPSLAFALQFIGSGIGGILMGYWTDRWGAGRPALLGAVMIGSGAIVAHYMRTEWELYLIYGVMLGFVGQSTLHTPLLANIMLWFTKRRGMAIGLVISGQSMAGMVCAGGACGGLVTPRTLPAGLSSGKAARLLSRPGGLSFDDRLAEMAWQTTNGRS